AYRVLEAHVYVNHIAFVITTEILDLSASKYVNEKKSYIDLYGFSEVETNTRPYQLAAMKSLISRLSGRLDHEIPTGKGVCIPNGFILDDDDKHKEQIKFIYKNNELLLSVDVDNSYLASSDTLFSRGAKINSAMGQQSMQTIKKENLLPNGLPSQEWLMKGKQEVYSEEKNKKIPNMPYYQFWLYANQETATLTTPRVLVKLNNVNRFTTYSDAQMVEIWDRIVNSLRYRPNAF
ncbi:T6SS immunity protein Tli4 family protein, partial [Providencia burhodogranariea]